MELELASWTELEHHVEICSVLRRGIRLIGKMGSKQDEDESSTSAYSCKNQSRMARRKELSKPSEKRKLNLANVRAALEMREDLALSWCRQYRRFPLQYCISLGRDERGARGDKGWENWNKTKQRDLFDYVSFVHFFYNSNRIWIDMFHGVDLGENEKDAAHESWERT